MVYCMGSFYRFCSFISFYNYSTEVVWTDSCLDYNNTNCISKLYRIVCNNNNNIHNNDNINGKFPFSYLFLLSPWSMKCGRAWIEVEPIALELFSIQA